MYKNKRYRTAGSGNLTTQQPAKATSKVTPENNENLNAEKEKPNVGKFFCFDFAGFLLSLPFFPNFQDEDRFQVPCSQNDVGSRFLSQRNILRTQSQASLLSSAPASFFESVLIKCDVDIKSNESCIVLRKLVNFSSLGPHNSCIVFR